MPAASPPIEVRNDYVIIFAENTQMIKTIELKNIKPNPFNARSGTAAIARARKEIKIR